MVQWITHGDDDVEALYDPDELIIRFYIAVEHLFYIGPFEIFDMHALQFHTAQDLRQAHPHILTAPDTGQQYRPISELNLIKSSIRHEAVSADSYKTTNTVLSLAAIAEDVIYAPKTDPDHRWADLPASLFVVDVHLDTLHLLDHGLRNSFVSYNYVRSPEQANSKVLDRAFEEAVHHLQVITSSTYKLARNSIEPFNAKILEPQIPYAIFKNDADSAALRTGFVDNAARQNVLKRATLPRTSNDLSQLELANEAGPFDDHVLMAQEASAAFSRGLNRSAIVMIASSTETFLNTVLQLLHWEKGTLPEKSAEHWKEFESIKTRVTSNFQKLLGGSWTFDHRSKALSDWDLNIVRLRNDVAHGTRLPTDAEIEDAFNAMDNLVTDMIDRLTNDRNRNQYIRTAFLLAGNNGLEKRQALTPKLRQLQDDPSETIWRQSSLAWMGHHLSCLQQKRGLWEENVPTEIVLVIRSQDRYVAAFEFSPHMLWAREVENVQHLVQQLPHTQLSDTVPKTAWDPAIEYITNDVTQVSMSGLEFGDKVPAYHLVPYMHVTPGYLDPLKLTFRYIDS